MVACRFRPQLCLAMRFKQKVQEHAVPAESTPGDLSFSATKIAVAQISKSIGFKSTISSLAILTEVAIRYVVSIAKSAVSSANSSSRTESNIFYILHAIDDVHLVLGFTGASCIHMNKTPLWTSGIVLEPIQFVKHSREIPFAKPLPRCDTQSKPPLIERDHISTSLPHHIPKWLPALPNVATHPEKVRRIRPLWGEINAVEAAASDQDKCEENKASADPGLQEVNIATQMAKIVGNGIGGRLRNVVSYGEKRVYCNMDGDDDAIAQTKKRKKASNVLS